MSPDTLKLYHSTASPNSRRVRIFLAEKGLKVPLVSVDLGKGEQHSASYRTINPRRVVPTLVLDDGTAIALFRGRHHTLVTLDFAKALELTAQPRGAHALV